MDQTSDIRETVVEILAGRIMTVRGSGQRPIKLQWNGNFGSLIGSGEGAFGVVIQDGSMIVDCLQGTCNILSAKDDPVEVVTGQRVVVSTNEVNTITNVVSDDHEDWNSLCGGCLQDN
jgi:ferric-dicitrate binding protein FerR (iron transport regulator)